MLELPLEPLKQLVKGNKEVLMTMLSRGVASPLTSSAGRLFDAVSALLGIRSSINYEGQAAIELEMCALPASADDSYAIDDISADDKGGISLAPLIRRIVEDILKNVPYPLISWKFHRAVAGIITETCRNVRQRQGNTRVAISGGVFQNMLLLEETVRQLENAGFHILLHGRVPANDGGIALGQAVIAQARC
jgi:hydrogenase maturation protein HypF